MCRRLKGCCPNISLPQQTPNEAVAVTVTSFRGVSPDRERSLVMYDVKPEFENDTRKASEVMTLPPEAVNFCALVTTAEVLGLKSMANNHVALGDALAIIGSLDSLPTDQVQQWADFLKYGVRVSLSGRALVLHVPEMYTVPESDQPANGD